ncbi:WD repeat-containing protein [Actinidia chinensis var. chinensis]|uniref:WD repeat-containing protein n=1 Tax=Actinidia chinensis var. chinensis TaxID=1590841 RepID=A0A2R6QZU8_ACTCC|nr:WD repeat-containing protein [Actinidia chinensis var. chinensis]
MARLKLKSLITFFTPEGDYLATLSPNGVVKIWNTNSGTLLAEWRQSNADSDVSFSCMACSFVGKKRRKEHGTCLLALGSDAGEVLVVDVFTGEKKWKSTGCHPGGIAGLCFTNRGHILLVVGKDGVAFEMNSVTGEVVKKFKVSKTPISSLACCYDEKILAFASGKIRIFSWENEKELLKFSADGGLGQHISISDDAKTIVTSGVGEKHLQVWKCDLSNGAVSKGPVLSMRHHPLAFECKSGANGEDSLVILSVSKSGVAYVWNLKASSEEEVIPTKVTVKASKGKMEVQNSGSDGRLPVMAARLHALGSDGQVTVLVAYGSADCPQFSFLDISNPSEDIVITAGAEMEKIGSKTVQENGVLAGGMHEENLEAVAVSIENKKANKKRAASDPDLADTKYLVDDDIGHTEPMDESQIDEDLNEPTMGDKLASLNLQENNNKSLDKKESSQHAKPPSADSIHVLLKQALHADDRALLVNCLDTQDDKVIANSVSLLNPSDILKLLDSLISLIHSRGAVLASSLPWLRSLLLQHASVVMSQESSLIALNSLYQLIESRVSTFHPALQLSSCLDLLYTAIVDDGFDENDGITPVVYEDKDESDEEESEDAMETTDQEDSDIEPFNDVSDLEGSDDMAFDL